MIRRTKGFFFLERFLWIFYHSNQTNNNSGNISPCPACNIQANGFFIFHSSCCWPRDGHCCFFSALSTFSLCSISGRQNYKGSPEGNDYRNRRRFDWGVKKNRRWICGFLRWKYQKGINEYQGKEHRTNVKEKDDINEAESGRAAETWKDPSRCAPFLRFLHLSWLFFSRQ